MCDSGLPAIKEYGILSKLNRTLADDTLLRQKLAVYLNTEPYPSTRLTFSKGNDAFPGISQDGKRIAFSSKRDGNPELYIMNSEGKDQRRLTKHLAVDYGPAFSPDGSRLLFVSDRDGNDEIYLFDLKEEKELRLTYNNADDWLPKFSPDGQEVFWASDRSGKFAVWRMEVRGAGEGNETNPQLLFECRGGEVAYFDVTAGRLIVQKETKNQEFMLLVNISDGREEELDSPSFRAGIPTVLSPDGKQIMYVSSREGTDEIYIYSTEQKRSIRLTNNSKEDFGFGFTPDSKTILFDSDRDGDRDVYLMRLNELITQEEILDRISKL